MESVDHSNPFSVTLAVGPPPRRRLWGAIRFLLLTMIATGALLGVSTHAKRWLVARLAKDFSSLPAEAKQQRLLQLADLGVAAMVPLASAIRDEDDAASETTFALLRSWQNEWVTLPNDQAAQSHAQLAAAINRVWQKHASSATPRQTARAEELLRQTMLEFADSATPMGRSVGSLAQSTLAMIQVPGSSEEPTANLARGSEIKIISAPAVRLSNSEADWTDWPPPGEGVRASSSKISTQIQVIQPEPTGLQPIQENEIPEFESIAQGESTEPPSAVRNASAAILAPPEDTGVIDNAMTALEDESVIAHLANPEWQVADQARRELTSRGFSDRQIQFATQLAVGSPSDRIALMESLVRSGDLDPRPWLLMLLEDSDRTVRLHCVAVLGGIDDPYTVTRLRQRLDRESDPVVATRLRRVLALR